MKKFTTKPRLFRSSTGYVGTPGYESDHWIYFGRLGEAGPLTDVRFDMDMAHVIAMFGKRGSGKSYTLGSLLEGLCTKRPECSIAKNSQKQAILLFDTLGIFQWMDLVLKDNAQKELLQQQFAVRRGWKISPEALNINIWIPEGTRCPNTPETHKEFTINSSDFSAEDWGYLFGLDIYQDRMGQLLNDAYIKVTLEGWSDSSCHQQPQPHYSLDDLIKCVKSDLELTETYQTETRRAVLQQLQTYHRNTLFHNHGTSLEEFLKPGTISVIVMNKMSDELRLIVVTSLLRQLISTRIRISEIEKNLKIVDNLSEEKRQQMQSLVAQSIPPTWVCIDEAQNILPSERKTTATDVLVKYVREGRNYGLSFVVATQQPTAIDQRILAQVDTMVVHKLTVQQDIDYIRKNIKSNLPDEVKYANAVLGFDNLIRSLDVGQALVSNTEADRAFIMNVRPRISVHGGF